MTGKLSAATERSLRDMFERQSESGAFVSHDEVEIPHITTDFELSLQAARAITAAPGWLAGLTDETLLRRVEKLKHWLRTAPPKNDFDRVLKLQLAHYLPELVSQTQRDAALALLSSKQHADGGWSTMLAGCSRNHQHVVLRGRAGTGAASRWDCETSSGR